MQTLKQAIDDWAHQAVTIRVGAAKQRKEPIHHYTSTVGLAGILQAHALWATQSDALNDPDDHRRYLRAFVDRFLKLSTPDRHTGLRAAFEQGIADRRARTFVTSFCDRADELSLWRAYGEGGRGFALAFPSMPAQPIPGTALIGPGPRAVTYADDDEMGRAIATRFDDLDLVVKKHNQDLTHPDAQSALIRDATFESARWKHPAFADEREYRWIVVQDGPDGVELDRTVARCRVHPSGESPIKTVDIPFAPTELLGITVGPGREFDSARKQLIEMLKFYGFDPAKVPIAKSRIPWV